MLNGEDEADSPFKNQSPSIVAEMENKAAEEHSKKVYTPINREGVRLDGRPKRYICIPSRYT